LGCYGTHLRAGEITAIRVDCSGRLFRITVTVYLDVNARISFGGANEILNFGDSTWIEVPEVPTTPRPDLGVRVGMASFTVEHTYTRNGSFLIRYAEGFRNADVLNLDSPLTANFYIETSVVVEPRFGCNSAPLVLVPPVDAACTGVAWFHNPGAYDPDGDSLSYELVIPYQDKAKPVSNYRFPDAKEFYDRVGITYATANETGTGPPTFGIDPRNGTITWDAPGSPNGYNIAFVIKEWRKIEGVWTVLGYILRDMQIVVSDCNNDRPRLEIPEDICVVAGELITHDIFAFDPDSDSVVIEAFSEVFSLAVSPAKMIPGPNNGNVKAMPSSPTAKAKVQFSWKTDCENVRDQSYQIVLKVMDRPGSGVRLIEFKTWNISVVGPAPHWDDAVSGNRIATLKWNSYECQNAEKVEVWRRVDSYPYTPTDCVTGIPDFLAFTKIAEVPITQSNFVDSNEGRGLAVGAKYCYRLVAVFKQPRGGESYVSRDTCLAPIVADAPVITTASIIKTHGSDGEVQVQWRSAFDMDKNQFPPPYTFEVWRAEGISAAGDYTNLTPTRLTDSSFVDSSDGLNTDEIIYSYRIVQYSHLRTDTSFAASTVRLEATPRVSKIEINWVANVPWSNRSYKNPYHLIYRGGIDDPILALIDSVDVNVNGLRYIDDGQYNDTPLNGSAIYCYYIQARGTYGNPLILEPLKNFSQMVCAQPYDTVPPCIPVLSVSAPTCEEQAITSFCGTGPFRNVVTWNRPTEACRADIRSYEIWVAGKKGSEFTFYRDNLRDTFFIDTNQNLSSFARCYKVLAVDRSGNRSALSDEFCFDNCAHYELPNVFTPNGDSHNEQFSAFGDQSRLIPGEPPGMTFHENCARFVESVDFIVFNRWGTEVYRASDLREDKIYVAWDGRDNQGRELDGGVYYYKARVRFVTVDPGKEVAEMKGWLQLIR
jgi:hypothetical protein